ncbi:MAG: type IV pilus twitching motility protein PilT [Planctomycetota bacterium]|jgi:twitching motility protein PilT|nr:type IV pilus twitching motility protein PilT [Planctomycetota bacterium]MDP6838554.1 type IV pilus twitching motility protein PilT [Planctomycetota bacterium]
MEELLALLVRQGGSDLHLSPGSPPRVRVDGVVTAVDLPPLTDDSSRRLITGILTSEQIAILDRERELDCALGLAGCGRFRVNAFYRQGAVAAVFRAIPDHIPSFAQLGLPVAVCERMASLRSGLVLFTGATGSGKSTSLAALLDHVNEHRQGHIVTIEDPVEFTHHHRNCVVTQREVGADTHGFARALKSVLRQDPDVVLVGELRDQQTIEAALTLAETGHLTLATLHTSDAPQTINRIVDVFPAESQAQVRTQLSFSLEGVICQQLLPLAAGRGRALAAEILLATPAVRALIRENRTHQLQSHLQTGARLGMCTMAHSLAGLVRSGRVRVADAEAALPDPTELHRLMRAA